MSLLNKEAQSAQARLIEQDDTIKRLRRIAEIKDSIYNRRNDMLEKLLNTAAMQEKATMLNEDIVLRFQNLVDLAFPLDAKLLKEEEKLFEIFSNKGV